MQKFLEGLSAFMLISFLLKLSVNYVLAPSFIFFVFGAAHLGYIKALAFYGLSNLVFKNLTSNLKLKGVPHEQTKSNANTR